MEDGKIQFLFSNENLSLETFWWWIHLVLLWWE